MRHLVLSFALIVMFLTPWLVINNPDQFRSVAETFGNAYDQLAAIITHNPRTIEGLQTKYTVSSLFGSQKIRILIVPGHEADYGGAEFGKIKERNLTVEIARDLVGFLKADASYEVFTTRDADGWVPEFAAYFEDNWDEIIDWEKTYKSEMSRLISVGSIKQPLSAVYHNTAPFDNAIRLYGMTKWANENSIDVTIHIHLNDTPNHRPGTAGTYTGFAIYVPSEQYMNSTTTHAIADTIFKRLAKYNPVSDLKGESTGIVDESELIAIGANNTSDAASMLIEYGYIYEPQFNDPDLRPLALKDLAYQTYLGLQDFFNPKGAPGLAREYDTLVLPHTWKEPITAKDTTGPDIFALQTALLIDGIYPPVDRSKNDCPRSGKLGACTRAALEVFQNKNGIAGEKGVVGEKTLKMLNESYGPAL